MNNSETVYGIDGAKVGVVVLEGTDWVAYSLSDLEVYRGPSANIACWTLQGRA
jgi:hypothetical protein